MSVAHIDSERIDAQPPTGSPASRPDLGILWFVVFVFGGGLFALYYSNIGYIPDIKWEDSAVYLGALTLAGAFLFSIYFVLLYIPGWIWSEFLIFDRLDCVFCDDQRQPQRWKIIRDIGLPFAGFLASAHLLLDSHLGPVGIAIWTTVLLIVFTALFGLILSRLERSGADLRFENLAFFALSSLASFLSMLLIRQSFDPESGQAMHIVCTVTVTVVNLYVATVCRKRPRVALLVMAGAAFVLMVLGDFLVAPHEKRLSARVMCKFGIGYGHPVTLLLTKQGAEIFARHGIQTRSKPLGPEACDIEILSRLGSEYFLRSKNPDRRFSFPKAGIVSWHFEKSGGESVRVERPRMAARAGGAEGSGLR